MWCLATECERASKASLPSEEWKEAGSAGGADWQVQEMAAREGTPEQQ